MTPSRRRPAVASAACERVGGGDINDAFRVQFATSRSRSSSPAPTRARRVRGRGRRPALARGAGRAARSRGARRATTARALALDWVDAGRARRDFGEHARRAGSPAARGGRATASAATRPLHTRAADAAQRRRAPTGRRSTPSAGCSRCCRTRALTALGTRPSSASARASHDLAGPPEPPARLHGDLWSGNVMWGPDGRAWLIDPAAYGGHREVDLAMLRLFGSPGPHFFAAYEERPRSRRATRSASRSTSCCRCSCTPRCSAAAIPPPPSAWRASTPKAGRTRRS